VLVVLGRSTQNAGKFPAGENGFADDLSSRCRGHAQGSSTASTPDFLAFSPPKIVDLVPGLAHLPALRAWGGVSSVTPDMQPILR